MVTADDAIRLLNEALAIDPQAVNRVFQHWPCNDELAKHPTIQVGEFNRGIPAEVRDHAMAQRTVHVSALGIINGIFGTQPGSSWGWIAAVIDIDTGRIIRFEPAVAPANRSDAQQS